MSLKIINDYGHGGADSGAVAGGIYEKDLAFDTGRRATKFAKDQGVIVEETRSNDRTLANGTRTVIIRNSGAKYAFSYHKNSATNKSAHGFEIWVSQYSNQRMAKAIEAELKAIGLHSRGVRVRKAKSGSDYYFMHRNTGNVETLILENLFISNGTDRAYLSNDNNRQKIADAIVKAICKVEGIKYNGEAISIPDNKPSIPNRKPTTSRPSTIWYSKNKKDNDKQGIIKLQKDLESLGYSVGRHGTNGIFGNDTESAVKKFQKANGLLVDGSAGPATLNKIKQSLGSNSFRLTYKRPLRQGSNGGDVKELQKALVKLGYNPKGIDGNFGPGCNRSVREFQGKNGLSIDGSVGPATVRKINELLRR